MFKTLIRAIADGIRCGVAHIALRFAKSEEAQGFALVDLTVNQEASSCFGKVKDALALIEQYDPLLIHIIRRRVARVTLIRSHGSAGEYWPHLAAIALDMDHVRSQVVPSIAMTVVHEGTHARIAKRLRGEAIGRDRIERLCVRAEVRFARKIPGTERLVEGAYQKLDFEWWNSSLGQRQFSKRLMALGAPRWLRRMLYWLRA